LLSNLSIEERVYFNDALEDCIIDPSWCERNGVDYSNPNSNVAKLHLYKVYLNEYIEQAKNVYE